MTNFNDDRWGEFTEMGGVIDYMYLTTVSIQFTTLIKIQISYFSGVSRSGLRFS